jgi:hypothetical protein
MKKENFLGLVFTRLTVTGPADSSKGGQAQWTCRCLCGREVVIRALLLKTGRTQSCGCLRAEITSARSKVIHKRHGATRNGVPTPEWSAWSGMRARCNNSAHKQYGHYGGRGITVCDSWNNSFETFLSDMGPRPSPLHSIDRINNNSGYCKENCRWATRTEQNNNLRTNHLVTIKGRTQTASQWSRELGVDRSVVKRMGNSNLSDSDVSVGTDFRS